MAAEMTSETFQDAAQLFGMKFVRFDATSASATDYVTVPGLRIIRGHLGIFSAAGAAASITITGTSNVLTFTNGNTVVWHGLVWGD